MPLLEGQGVTIGGKKTLIRGLRTRSIGIGGDSRIRWEDGRLLVGPERSGPAAALGGPFPTPTGRSDPSQTYVIGDYGKAAEAMLPLGRRDELPPSKK